MARGLKKHMKRIATPKHWYLSKLGGIFAPRPSTGPHKIRECMPMVVLIRDRLKYALTYNECKMIAMQRLIKVDGKVRTDKTYPIGFQDVVTIEKTQSNFRIMYDSKGRFAPHQITPEEAQYKLCRIKKVQLGDKGVPYAVTHDGRTLRFIHPDVRAHDVVRYDLESGKILDFLKFKEGHVAMVTGGHNQGRIGTITKREKHAGSVEIIHLKDAKGHEFVTRVTNVFMIGTQDKLWVSVPKDKGIRKTNVEDREARLKRNHAQVMI